MDFHTTVILSLIIIGVFLCLMALIGGWLKGKEDSRNAHRVPGEYGGFPPLPPVSSNGHKKEAGGIYEPMLGDTSHSLPEGVHGHKEIGGKYGDSN